MNQPHLSKTTRELEEALGIVIFKRTSKGMVPTKKGSEFMAYAKSILAQVEMMENLVNKGKPWKMALNIAVPRASYIAYAFTEFVKTLPHDRALAIDYRETNSVRAARDVANGENDLGIVRFPVEYENYFIEFLREKELDFEPISRFQYMALFSEHHPLAQEDSLDLLKFERYIEIIHGDTNVPSLSKIKRAPDGEDYKCEDCKKEIAVYERGSQLELLRRIPSTYMWVSPMPEEVLSTLSLVQRRCDMPKKYHKDLLIYRKGYRFTEDDRGFIVQLKQVVKEIFFFKK
jgi:DNA-binding transcriptional LysR family regulator